MRSPRTVFAPAPHERGWWWQVDFRSRAPAQRLLAYPECRANQVTGVFQECDLEVSVGNRCATPKLVVLPRLSRRICQNNFTQAILVVGRGGSDLGFGFVDLRRAEAVDRVEGVGELERGKGEA